MAKAKEVEAKTLEEVPTQPAKELVTEEMVEAAEASAKKRTMAAADNRSGVGTLRKQGGAGVGGSTMTVSDIPYPQDYHGENFEFYGPMGNASEVPVGTEVAPYSSEQEFIINEEKVTYFSFDKPGRNLPKKRLYNIKALHKDGRLVQLPFEAQIQNSAGGDPEDAIGLRRYERKGIKVLIDWQTMIPLYCAAWDCWAKAEESGNTVGFCSERHAKHTLPNTYKNAGAISKGLMEAGVTTSAVWGS